MVIMKVQHEPRRIGTQSNALDWRNILLGGIMLAVVSAFGSTLPTRLAQAQPVANGQAPKPNIVVMLMDNLGYGELGVYGGGILRGAPTPIIDKLASEGTGLLNFNVEAQCTPLRAQHS